MGLEPPDLDNRTFEELFEDVRRQIPTHSDEWTDHNETDPGITILETLAWVAESDIYQLDRITEAHIRKYLQLLGVRPYPPQPATVDLAVTPDSSAVGTKLKPGARLSGEYGTGSVVAFETASEVMLTDVDVAAVITEHAEGWSDNTHRNDSDGLYFLAFGEGARQGSAMYLGFRTDPFANSDRLDFRIDFHEANLPEPATHGPPSGEFEHPTAVDDHRQTAAAADDGTDPLAPIMDSITGEQSAMESTVFPSAEITWQYCTDLTEWYNDDRWEDFEDVDVTDRTDALYHGGAVTLDEPEDWTGDRHRIFDLERPLSWIRCVVSTPGHEIPPQLNAVRTNVVTARHGSSHRDDHRLQTPDGDTETSAHPDQEFVFERAPVRHATIEIDGDRWQEVPDFAASGPDAHHYVLDREQGVVRFGDNINGAVPPPGHAVVATSYEYGGGPEGNVPVETEWRLIDDSPGDVTITPLGPATGGKKAEPLDAALARLKQDLKRAYRAVTSEDIQQVAQQTPGLRFGRTAVRLNEDEEKMDAQSNDCGAHDTLQVVVVPAAGATTARPEPSRGFLAAVRNHLQRHRLLTDEIEVEPPEYIGVSVETEVEIESGYAQPQRVSAVRSTIDEFLDPLSGFDGEGWPFGRSVFPSELYETIGAVEGIDCVHDVRITGQGDFTVVDGAIDIPAQALVYPLGHTVAIRAADGSCERWSP